MQRKAKFLLSTPEVLKRLHIQKEGKTTKKEKLSKKCCKDLVDVSDEH